MARMVEGLLLQQHQHQHQQEPNRQRTASRSLIGISNGNRSNEVRVCSKMPSQKNPNPFLSLGLAEWAHFS